MKRVLIVDDSQVARDLLAYVLAQDPEIEVVGAAASGEEALRAVARLKPDVVTMDIQMPGMDGYETTRRIMETCPTPIVVVTASFHPGETDKTFQAIQAGALTILEKPRGVGRPDHDHLARDLLQTVKLMSEVKVVRRWVGGRPAAGPPRPSPDEAANALARDVEIVAIGASTGGPPVLQSILSEIPKDFPVPILIVQHIVPGFLSGLAEWLGHTTPLAVGIPMHGDRALPGHAYLAPEGYQMGVHGDGRITVMKEPPEHGLCPSASYLFRSVAQSFGGRSIGVLLTGMGTDGAAELGLMRQAGAVTIAQDRESSAVHGMPGEAIRLRAATHVLAPDETAVLLRRIAARGSPV